MSSKRVYYLSESKVFHLFSSCRSLRREDRYHPLRITTADSARTRGLRPCAYCARWRV